MKLEETFNGFKFIIIIALLIYSTTSIASISNNSINNKIKNNSVTTLNKDNINKFITRSNNTNKQSENKNIINFITTPNKMFMEKIEEKLSKIDFSRDQFLINKISKEMFNPLVKENNVKSEETFNVTVKKSFIEESTEIIKYINEKIAKKHPNARIPIAKLGQELEKESNKLDKYLSKINYFLEKNKKSKINIVIEIEQIDIFLNKIDEFKKNIVIISNFLNNLFSA